MSIKDRRSRMKFAESQYPETLCDHRANCTKLTPELLNTGDCPGNSKWDYTSILSLACFCLELSSDVENPRSLQQWPVRLTRSPQPVPNPPIPNRKLRP